MAKEVSFVSPIGIAVYPKITKPDIYGKYADNKYKTELELTPADLAKVEAEIKTAMRKMSFKVSNPKLPFKEGVDGIRRLTAKSKFIPMIIDAKKVKLYDSFLGRTDANELAKAEAIHICGGSRIKIGGTLFPYDKGVSLQLNAVQIIELVGGQIDGFDEEDTEADQDTSEMDAGDLGDAAEVNDDALDI